MERDHVLEVKFLSEGRLTDIQKIQPSHAYRFIELSNLTQLHRWAVKQGSRAARQINGLYGPINMQIGSIH